MSWAVSSVAALGKRMANGLMGSTGMSMEAEKAAFLTSSG